MRNSGNIIERATFWVTVKYKRQCIAGACKRGKLNGVRKRIRLIDRHQKE